MGDLAEVQNGASETVNGTGDGAALNGDVKKEHKSEHRSKEHKSKKSKHKDKDRERSRDHKSSHKDKHRSKDHKSHKSSSKDKERDRSSGRKDGEKDRDKDKHKDKDKHRDKDKQRDKDKHRNDKDKHKEHKDRHKEDKNKHRTHEDKDRHRRKDGGDASIKEETKASIKVEPASLKVEPASPIKPALTPPPAPAVFDEPSDDDFEPALVIKEESVSKEELASEEEGPGSEDERPESEEVRPGSEEERPGSEDERAGSEDEREGSEDEVPLSARQKLAQYASDSEEDAPLSARKLKPKPKSKAKRKAASDSEDDYDRRPVKKAKKEPVKRKSVTETASPTKKKKVVEEAPVWKWWEEEKKDNDGKKWYFLEHKGVLLATEYEPLPAHVKFLYDGQEMKLSPETEEIATFYSKMLDHDYTTRDVFNTNFFGDWRKTMTAKEQSKITNLKLCNFTKMATYFKEQTELRKAMSKEEKKALKEKNEGIIKEYGFCTLDGHTERIGNFRAEPPGLFRGRGDHPKQGKVKRRILAKDIIINCSKDSKIPEPPPGQKWKQVRHDNTVTWLASWTENIQGQIKYVMLNAASRLKGEKDWQKYETARRLDKLVDRIRNSYREDFKSKEMRIRQRAVAMYFIDKLALRAGNEKDEDQADTVGCCSLRVEHIRLEDELNGKQYVVVFDFLGKDSIRYYNEVGVEKRVYKNLQLFMENKDPKDDLFDRLTTAVLNKHLTDEMDGLTAKVFRTYNASRTLQDQLDQLTKDDMTVNERILAYNRANRAVAILCNHQRAVPKTFEKSMENIMKKIADKKELLEDAEKQLKSAKRASKSGGSVKERSLLELKRKAVQRIREQLNKLELSATDKEENKEIALGTSKLNYLDPRISVAWCKKWEVPIEKIYNKTQRDKFRWAIDMAGPEFVF